MPKKSTMKGTSFSIRPSVFFEEIFKHPSVINTQIILTYLLQPMKVFECFFLSLQARTFFSKRWTYQMHICMGPLRSPFRSSWFFKEIQAEQECLCLQQKNLYEAMLTWQVWGSLINLIYCTAISKHVSFMKASYFYKSDSRLFHPPSCPK